MTLQLHDTSDAVICTLADDNETLASYGPQVGYTIHVFDANPMSQLKGLEDVSQVQKYEISEEAYAKRDGTFRQFKQKMMKEDPDFMKKNKEKAADEEYGKEEASKIEVGQRCELTVGARRGVVKYVGKAKEAGKGYWVGVQLDEPTGDNNGTLQGKQYFEAPEKHGIMMRPETVKVGDFPPIDVFNEEEDEI